MGARSDDECLAELRAKVDQLEAALESRVAIEQAVGMLAERYGLSMPDAFALLRQAARNSRRDLHVLAEEIVDVRPRTPAAVTAARQASLG